MTRWLLYAKDSYDVERAPLASSASEDERRDWFAEVGAESRRRRPSCRLPRPQRAVRRRHASTSRAVRRLGAGAPRSAEPDGCVLVQQDARRRRPPSAQGRRRRRPHRARRLGAAHRCRRTRPGLSWTGSAKHIGLRAQGAIATSTRWTANPVPRCDSRSRTPISGENPHQPHRGFHAVGTCRQANPRRRRRAASAVRLRFVGALVPFRKGSGPVDAPKQTAGRAEGEHPFHAPVRCTPGYTDSSDVGVAGAPLATRSASRRAITFPSARCRWGRSRR